MPYRDPYGRTSAEVHREVCRQCEKLLRVAGVWYHKNLGTVGVRRGLPDYFLAVPFSYQRMEVRDRTGKVLQVIDPVVAKFAAAEIKTGESVLSKTQRAIKDELEAVGVEYLVIRDVKELAEWLNEATGRKLEVT